MMMLLISGAPSCWLGAPGARVSSLLGVPFVAGVFGGAHVARWRLVLGSPCLLGGKLRAPSLLPLLMGMGILTVSASSSRESARLGALVDWVLAGRSS